MNFSSLNIYILTFIYFALSLIGVLNHEIWFDEAHHWLLSRESVSFQDLLFNTRYEGQPRMWSLLLYYVSRFSHNPFWMQFLHISISTLTIFVFLKKAPFSILFKSFFIFGYFMFFEYNLLSRNYMLGVLFLFSAMGLYEKRNENFLLISLLLVLSSNIHLMFVVLSSSLFLIIFLEHYSTNNFLKKGNIFGYLLFLFGVCFSLLQMIPASDSEFFNDINNLPLLQRLSKGFIAVWKGLIIIPDFRTIHFWNTNVLINISKPLTAALGLLIYFTPILIFHKNKKVLLYVYLSIFIAQLFFFITQRGNARSYGMIYLIFLIGLWIEKYSAANPLNITKKLTKKTLIKIKNISIYTVLCIHLFSGVLAYAIDLKEPFNSAKKVVSYIKSNNYQEKIIITPNCDSPISSYIEGKTFSLCTNSFVAFSHSYYNCVDEGSTKTLLSFLKKQNSSCIYITMKDFFDDKDMKKNKVQIENTLEINFLESFNENIVSNRYYYIYEVEYKKNTQLSLSNLSL